MAFHRKCRAKGQRTHFSLGSPKEEDDEDEKKKTNNIVKYRLSRLRVVVVVVVVAGVCCTLVVISPYFISSRSERVQKSVSKENTLGTRSTRTHNSLRPSTLPPCHIIKTYVSTSKLWYTSHFAFPRSLSHSVLVRLLVRSFAGAQHARFSMCKSVYERTCCVLCTYVYVNRSPD